MGMVLYGCISPERVREFVFFPSFWLVHRARLTTFTALFVRRTIVINRFLYLVNLSSAAYITLTLALRSPAHSPTHAAHSIWVANVAERDIRRTYHGNAFSGDKCVLHESIRACVLIVLIFCAN